MAKLTFNVSDEVAMMAKCVEKGEATGLKGITLENVLLRGFEALVKEKRDYFELDLLIPTVLGCEDEDFHAAARDVVDGLSFRELLTLTPEDVKALTLRWLEGDLEEEEE